MFLSWGPRFYNGSQSSYLAAAPEADVQSVWHVLVAGLHEFIFLASLHHRRESFQRGSARERTIKTEILGPVETSFTMPIDYFLARN